MPIDKPSAQMQAHIDALVGALKGVKGAQQAGVVSPNREKMQAAFGTDFSAAKARAGGAAAASKGMGAAAYASGNQIAFKGSPNLHTAAHEAAHVMQQRAGVGLGGPKEASMQMALEVAKRSLASQVERAVNSASSGAASAATVAKSLAAAQQAVRTLAVLEQLSPASSAAAPPSAGKQSSGKQSWGKQ